MMPLAYKQDWDAAKTRYQAWWAHEAIGRCALAVCAPKDDPPDTPPPPEPQTLEARWWDLDRISDRVAYGLGRTYFGGEALPIWSAGYPGHTAIPAFLGCPTTLDMRTGWWDPILTDEDIDVRALRIDEQDKYWRFAVSLLERGVQEATGKALVTIGAFGGCGDTLAALRGTEELLIDCVERPDQVRAAEEALMDMWFEVYDRFYAIIQDADQGSTCWFSLWSPGKFYAAQNDFSYNISPRMFRDIFLPVVARQTEFLDHTVYHVDGENAFGHVDALLELPHLQAIQILPGAGKPSPLQYMDVLKKVQAAGKNLHITIPAKEVRVALQSLSARGLFIQVSGRMDTEAEARALLKQAEVWSRDTVLV